MPKLKLKLLDLPEPAGKVKRSTRAERDADFDRTHDTIARMAKRAGENSLKPRHKYPIFKVEIPLHEVAANSKDDIVSSLRHIANKIESLSEEDAFAPFSLDGESVASLSYVSYGTEGVR